jgi:hypothetical protein
MSEEYYGIGEKPEYRGMTHYRPPFYYELNGQSYKLMLDNGDKYFIRFSEPNIVEWSKNSDTFQCSEYECLKGDEALYLVNFLAAGLRPTTCMSFILDFEQRLCMLVIARTDAEPEPLMVTNEIIMGAVDFSNIELPSNRFSYTDDLVGKRITWTYGPNMSITHVYYDTNYIRIHLPQEFRTGWPMTEALEGVWQAMDETDYEYDERTHYIKLRDHVYVLSVLEQMMVKKGMIGNNLLFLMNLSRVHDVGRSFGHTHENSIENDMFAAVGRWEKSDGKIESRINERLPEEIKYNA